MTREGDSTLTRSLRLHSGDARWRRGTAIARRAFLVRLKFVDNISACILMMEVKKKHQSRSPLASGTLQCDAVQVLSCELSG